MSEFGNDFEKELSIPDRNLDTRMSPESEQTMNELFKGDFDGVAIEKINDFPGNINSESEMKSLFADDFLGPTEGTGNNDDTNEAEQSEDVDITKQHEPNSKFEVNGKIYETDDNGYIYKIDGVLLLPDSEYTINGYTYKTDDHGRIESWDGRVRLVKQKDVEKRNLEAQSSAGGEDREEGDHGGHIIARIFGGASGIENILPMRAPINQSGYKKMENEIAKALDEGKEVYIHGDIEYEGDSRRPSKITVKYTIDGKETVVQFDNDEGSADLLDSLEGKIEDDDLNDFLNDLKQEIQDANKDGANISVMSVKTEYDAEGNIIKVTVTTRDDNSENEDRVYQLKEEA